MKKYLAKHHQWIIGTLIIVMIPLVSYYFQQHLNSKKETVSYYFADFSRDKDAVMGSSEASCWTSSVASNRTDAHRCSTEMGIEDPCFRDPFTESLLVCPHDPNGDYQYFDIKDGNFIPETNLPNKNTSPDDKYPWYIRLHEQSSGCSFITGATNLVADMRIDYSCGSKDDTEYLLLPIIKDGSLLKIGCFKEGKISSCAIKEVWY